jgi:hypothetical protein
VTPLGLSFIAFACVFLSALAGLFLHDILPKDHLSGDSKDTVKLGMGMVATLAALILGLLIGFATTSFNTMRGEIQETAAHIVLLDRLMANYGAETQEIRALLRSTTEARVASIWPGGDFEPSRFESADAITAGEAIQTKIRELSPRTDGQRWLQSRALSISNEIAQTRWLLVAQADNSIPPILLAVVIFWVAVIFLSFGIFAPRNATVVAALLICALSVSASIFLLLELNGPFDGAIKISSAPMRDALAHLGR